MTGENISEVMSTVQDDQLEYVFRGPRIKNYELHQQSSTTANCRERLIAYFLKYSPMATSWSDVAGLLYREKQSTAVEAAKTFITQKTGKTILVLTS